LKKISEDQDFVSGGRRVAALESLESFDCNARCGDKLIQR